MRKYYILLKALLEGLKGEYRRPAKALLWAMAIGQWMMISFLEVLFLCFLLRMLGMFT